MFVVSHRAIRLFCDRYPDAETPLDRWYRVAKRAEWTSFADGKQSFSTADWVAPHIIFDFGGHKFRLVAEINFRKGVLFIRDIMTHKEYEKGAWKP